MQTQLDKLTDYIGGKTKKELITSFLLSWQDGDAERLGSVAECLFLPNVAVYEIIDQTLHGAPQMTHDVGWLELSWLHLVSIRWFYSGAM